MWQMTKQNMSTKSAYSESTDDEWLGDSVLTHYPQACSLMHTFTKGRCGAACFHSSAFTAYYALLLSSHIQHRIYWHTQHGICMADAFSHHAQLHMNASQASLPNGGLIT